MRNRALNHILKFIYPAVILLAAVLTWKNQPPESDFLNPQIALTQDSHH